MTGASRRTAAVVALCLSLGVLVPLVLANPLLGLVVAVSTLLFIVGMKIGLARGWIGSSRNRAGDVLCLIPLGDDFPELVARQVRNFRRALYSISTMNDVVTGYVKFEDGIRWRSSGFQRLFGMADLYVPRGEIQSVVVRDIETRAVTIDVCLTAGGQVTMKVFDPKWALGALADAGLAPMDPS
jgi:hypothetical protein